MADYYANDRYTFFDSSFNTLSGTFNTLNLNAIY